MDWPRNSTILPSFSCSLNSGSVGFPLLLVMLPDIQARNLGRVRGDRASEEWTILGAKFLRMKKSHAGNKLLRYCRVEVFIDRPTVHKTCQEMVSGRRAVIPLVRETVGRWLCFCCRYRLHHDTGGWAANMATRRNGTSPEQSDMWKAESRARAWSMVEKE